MATARKAAAPSTAKPAAQPVAKKAVPSKAAQAVSSPVKAAKAPKTAAPKTTAPKAEKKAKPEKVKVVRDSFTIPKSEYAAIADLKKRALSLGTEVKKSELIRAGLMLLAAGSDAAFGQALSQVPTLKTGRPGKA